MKAVKYAAVALILFIIDQLTKLWVVKTIPLQDYVPVLGEFFGFTSHRNTGAAFGILENQRWFFIIITVIIVVGIILYLRGTIRENKKLLSFALSMLLGGALGNFIDRAISGEVVDFFQVHFQFSLFGKEIDYIYPIFNVADCAIVIGVILIFLDAILSWLKERKEQKVTHHEE